MNLVAMTPHGELSSTKYCLANPTRRGAEYLVYLNGARSATVNLTATPGTLTAEWFNTTTGLAISGGTVIGGARYRFKSPEGAEVLYIHN